MGRGLRGVLQEHVRLIDLSLSHSVFHAGTRTSKDRLHRPSPCRDRAGGLGDASPEQALHNAPNAPVITEAAFPDQLGLANEKILLDSHAGTHMDAPWHFGPLCESRAAKTIDQIPLEWCFGPASVLDVRHKKAGETITPEDLRQARTASLIRSGP